MPLPRIRFQFSLKTALALMVIVACSLVSYRVGWPMKVWRPTKAECENARRLGFDPFRFTEHDEPDAQFLKEHGLPGPSPLRRWGAVPLPQYVDTPTYMMELEFSWLALAVNELVILLPWAAIFLAGRFMRPRSQPHAAG
jgi:hypothetical protein